MVAIPPSPRSYSGAFVALKSITYLTCNALSCGASFPADVILCIPSAKVAPDNCPDMVAEDEEPYNHILGTLTDAKKVPAGCGTCMWQYTIVYDDVQITTGQTLLSTDITGVLCKGCLTTYIEDKAGNEVSLVENDDGTATFTSQHGCTTTFAIGGSGITVDDTFSVNLTLTGAALSADVNISADPGNEISILADGLFATTTYIPLADGVTDLGTLLLRFKDLYISGSVKAPNNVAYQARNAANSAWIDLLKADASNITQLNTLGTTQFTVAGVSIANVTAVGIRPELDGDNVSSNLGSATFGFKNVYLSDAVNRAQVFVSNGLYVSYPTGQSLIFRNASTDMWSFSSAGEFTQDATNGGDIVFGRAAGTIRQNTSDNTDNKVTFVTGGGATGSTRGASLSLYGNEYIGGDGQVVLSAGNVGATSEVNIQTTNASAPINFKTGSLTRWSINSSGQFVQEATNGGEILFGKSSSGIRGSWDGSAVNSNLHMYAGNSGSTAQGSLLIMTTTFGGGNLEQYHGTGGAIKLFGSSATGHYSISGTGSPTFAQVSPYGGSRNLKMTDQLLSGLTGASVTTSGLVPAKYKLVGIIVRVNTLITGATSFSVGDGSDVDRWGANIAVAAGTATSETDFTANPESWSAAAQEVTLTANGGNFSAGAVRVVAFYEDFSPLTS